MPPLSLMSPDHLYFESYLEMAAVKKHVVEYQLSGENTSKKMFVARVIYKDSGIVIQTTKGLLLKKETLEGIYVPEDPGNLEAISCLCH